MPENPKESGEDVGLFWSLDNLGQAYETLIARSGLPVKAPTLPGEPDIDDPFRALQWIRRAPRTMGLEPMEEGLQLDDLLERYLQTSGPMLTWCYADAPIIIIGILEGLRWVRVIKPDGSEVRMGRVELWNALAERVAMSSARVQHVFEGLPGGEAVFRRLLRNQAFVGDRVRTVRLFRFELDSAHPILQQLSVAGAWRALVLHIVLSLIQLAAALLALWTLGTSLVDGRIDAGRVLGWCLLAASDAPLQYLSSRALARFSISFGATIKRRLLEGTFFTSEKDVRAKGFGELIARTNEASVAEQLTLNEISGAVLALFEVFGAIFMFAKGAQTFASLVALGATLVLTFVVARASVIGYRTAFTYRLKLTDDLVDKIIGHRTRAAQQSPTQRHLAEDFSLSEYAREARKLDGALALATIMPRVWLVVGAGVLLYAFTLGTPLQLMLFSGLGILLGYRALVVFFPAVRRFAEWHTAWRGIESLITAGRTRERPNRALDIDVEEGDFATALSMSATSFMYRSGGRPVLNNANLRVRANEKVLLEGPSGSGKTTVLKLIAGEQQASAGVILVGGTDRFSVSDLEWRRRVASAPQFHENHVFANTFAFNLDPWGEPAFVSAEAEDICNELGLGPLLERMPMGYAQIIGETGWQLSHGERSRLFIARALLQKADIFLFDENFGALDPETLIQSLECVRRRAKTLIVVAHT